MHLEETQEEETKKTPLPPEGEALVVSEETEETEEAQETNSGGSQFKETEGTEETKEERLISKINLKTGSQLEPKDFTRFLDTRVNRWGFSVEDLEAVVDHKAKEWQGTDLERSLRPTVLFKTRARTAEYLADARRANTRPKGLGTSHRLFTRKELEMPSVTPQDRENAKGHLVNLRASLARKAAR